jgi:RNA-directed DNA polymerase
MAKREAQSPMQTDSLMEEVCQRDNLWQALKRVQANKGAPGVDGMTVRKLPKHLKRHWPKIREQLLAGT